MKHLGNSLSVAYLYDVYEDEKCVDLVMELCEGGQLWKRIRQVRRILENQLSMLVNLFFPLYNNVMLTTNWTAKYIEKSFV